MLLLNWSGRGCTKRMGLRCETTTQVHDETVSRQTGLPSQQRKVRPTGMTQGYALTAGGPRMCGALGCNDGRRVGCGAWQQRRAVGEGVGG